MLRRFLKKVFANYSKKIERKDKMVKFHFSPRENQAHLINWKEWSNEAFEEAKKQKKLILLSIGAVWCHWCHVMDEEAYSDQKNIDLINERFIPIRVDNDKQPDINRRYNMGGWPTTAILNHEGELLQGGTYLPSDNLHNFLIEIDQIYQENTDEIENKIKELYVKQQERYQQVQERNLDEDMILEVRSIIVDQFDEAHGGFGRAPKFPHVDALDFLLDEYYRTKRDDLANILNTTLLNMSSRGMFDREMGGFFRYSTTRDWSIPHFEKMLEDNAKLLNLYLKAFQIFNDGNYKEVALDVIMYLKDWLLDQEHGYFYGSQDADEKYYQMTRAEREKVKPPYIDKTLYVNWNGLAISAFLKAFQVLDALDCRDIALNALDFILKNCFKSEEGMVHYYLDGRGENTRLLDDQMTVINALLDAYESTNRENYLKQAYELADLVIARFYDEEQFGFYIDLPENNTLRRTNLLEKPLEINSSMADLFLRLAIITNNDRYQKIAIKTLRLCADSYYDYELFAATFASALSGYIYGFTRITIVGQFEDKHIREIYQESIKAYSAHKIVEELDPLHDKEQIENLGYDLQKSQAYICKGKKCYPPVENAEDISKVLATL